MSLFVNGKPVPAPCCDAPWAHSHDADGVIAPPIADVTAPATEAVRGLCYSAEARRVCVTPAPVPEPERCVGTLRHAAGICDCKPAPPPSAKRRIIGSGPGADPVETTCFSPPPSGEMTFANDRIVDRDGVERMLIGSPYETTLLAHDAALRYRLLQREADIRGWRVNDDDAQRVVAALRAEVEMWKDHAKFADAKCGDYWKMLHAAEAEVERLKREYETIKSEDDRHFDRMSVAHKERDAALAALAADTVSKLDQRRENEWNR